MKAVEGLVGFRLEAGDAGGVRAFSVKFTMVIKVDPGISRFDYSVAMIIETETNTRRENRVSVLNDEFIVATIKPALI